MSEAPPRTALPPPDIVLLVEDQDSHEIRNVTLVVGENCKQPVPGDRKASVSSVTSTIGVKGRGFGSKSREIRCWKCNKYVLTRVKKTMTQKGFATSVIVCIFCPLFAICAIPLILRSHHIVVHKCPLCKMRLGSSS